MPTKFVPLSSEEKGDIMRATDGITRSTDDPWGAHSSTYDQMFSPLTGYIGRATIAMTETRLPVGARILDIACGSGALLIPAIERAMHKRKEGGLDKVVGCDFSPGMVALARAKAERLGDCEVFDCQVHDGQALGFDDQSFDAAFSCFGIFLFENRQSGWREAARILKSGGVFATTSWMAPEHNEMMRVQFGPLMEALPDRLKENMQPPGWLTVADPETFSSEVADAGFEDIVVRPFHTDFVLPSIDSAWYAMCDNPVSGALLRQCDSAETSRLKEAYSSALATKASGIDRPIVLRASCNILVARRR
ncbi:MAG: methyltransferase domain-containing protein [Cyanobacteria bacterium P01_A01_bin.37]